MFSIPTESALDKTTRQAREDEQACSSRIRELESQRQAQSAYDSRLNRREQSLILNFLGRVKFCADSILQKKSFGCDYKLRSSVYTHTKRSHTHVKDLVAHVRVPLIMETLKYPACTVGWVARRRSQLSPGKKKNEFSPKFNRTMQLLKKNCRIMFE